MDERARALARVPAEVAAAAAGAFVVFGLGAERYAVAVAYVREVRRLADLTPLPGAGPRVAGVTNLRGQILVVFDLRGLFGLAREAGTGEEARAVVLGTTARSSACWPTRSTRSPRCAKTRCWRRRP
jgi:chemotaxis signal transduction protein